MSNRRTTTLKQQLHREVLDAALLGDVDALERLAAQCSRLPRAEAASLLVQIAHAAGCYARRVPEVERREITSGLLNARGILALMGVAACR